MSRLLQASAVLVALFAAAAARASDVAGDATPFESSVPVPETTLSTIAGRANVAMAVNANNTAQVNGNSVNGTSTTGDIRFDTSSFADLRGLSLLSANTGNNVAINSSLNVNVSVGR
jgi:hypothetical protein